jgi:large subunit ribosomal protein L21
MQYAVFQAGGHQYRAKVGDTFPVDKLVGQVGDKVCFDKVLLVNDEQGLQLGKPYLAKAQVEATIKEQKRDDKVLVFKYKRRKNYKKMRGHKQPITVIEIGKISHSA